MDSPDTDLPRLALVKELARLAGSGRQDSDRWSVVQDELTRRRVERAREHPNTAAPESIRTRILTLLHEQPGSTPSQVANVLGKTTTVVSRVLAVLLEDGVIQYTGTDGDRRKRHYSLVEAGDGQGAASDETSTPTNAEMERQHIALAIGGAVEARRKKHDLEFARDRLGRLLTQATRIDAHDLALLARTELITTLRQESETAPASESARAEHLAGLTELLRADSSMPTYLGTPAIGCLEYELGRDKTKPIADRLRHLTAAEMAFGRCADLDRARHWTPREGWALLSRAELWRKQTEFGKAQSLALQAGNAFEAYDDRYGAAEAFRVLGFCQRLRGDFAGAITTLEHAMQLEGEEVSDRCRADVALQLGDAYRCHGDLEEARGLLEEAETLAQTLGRTTTLGFVLTSLAAVEYAYGAMDAALTTAVRAQEALVNAAGGRAMNDRRLAVIHRELAEGGDTKQAKVSAHLFRRALDSYRILGSPAGTAACIVGFGNLPGQDQDQAVAGLVDVASSTDGRMLLPKDPWLPGLVSKWAEATANDDVHDVVTWTFKDSPQVQTSAEMAAEPRIRSTVDAV